MSIRLFVATCLAVSAGAALCGTAVAADAESTTISGRMFADLTNIDLTNDGVDSTANGTGIDVKRFYLGVTHNFDEIWSVNVTSDFNYVSNDGETQIYIKKAYIQAKLSDALTGRLGSADMPWVPFVENVYGYRFVEQVIVDRLKFGTSADWGLHGGGQMAGGALNYAVSVINGGGYKNPTRSNAVDVEGRVGFSPMKGLVLAAGVYSGKLGKDVEGIQTFHTANRFDALAAYSANGLRLGAEYFQAKNWGQVLTATSDKADGFSVWASYDFSPQWGVFARGDRAKTSKDVLPDLKDKYFNAGFVTHPRKNIDVALAYKYEKVDGGGFVNTANGLIGGVSEGKYREVGVWAQVNF